MNNIIKYLSSPRDANKSSKSMEANGCPFLKNGKGGAKLVKPVEEDKICINTCPFGHGSVGVNPFPNYRQGAAPAICPNKCQPIPSLKRYGHDSETPMETLVREATEFQQLYTKERNVDPEVASARLAAVLNEIKTTGTYVHTYDELVIGSRVSWRNAPKCSNRKYWDTLNVIDARSADTPEEMFGACLSLLEKANETFATSSQSNVLFFRPQTPGTKDGPRVWNSQLLRFAGYRDGTSENVYGDPSELGFAQMLENEYGWTPPTPRSRFDLMPLLLQSHPEKPPQLFHIPKHYCPIVNLSHPKYSWFEDLQLKWYAIPAVSTMEFTIGGLIYTAAPFNGWYSVTEIVRNLTDEHRYNLTETVALKMGLNTKTEMSLWRDIAMTEMAVAILHSFTTVGYAIVDHNTLMQEFYAWYHKEIKERGYCPGNWKWIIPPMAASLSKAYLGLNHMTEYTLKPAILPGPGYLEIRRRWKKSPDFDKYPVTLSINTACSKLVVHRRMNQRNKAVKALRPVLGDFKRKYSKTKSGCITIIYMTVFGTSKAVAARLYEVLCKSGCVVRLFDCERLTKDDIRREIAMSDAVLVVTSTAGSGEVPKSGNLLLNELMSAESNGAMLARKHFSVLGLGSKAYPLFCAAAEEVDAVFRTAGGTALTTKLHKVDSLENSEWSIGLWIEEVVKALGEHDIIQSHKLFDVLNSHRMIAQDNANESLNESEEPLYHVHLMLTDHTTVSLATESNCEVASVLSQDVIMDGEVENGTYLKLQVALKAGENNFNVDAGDEIKVFATNSDTDVALAAAGLGFVGNKLDTVFDFQLSKSYTNEADDSDVVPPPKFPTPQTVRVALKRYLALNDIMSFKGISKLSSLCPNDKQLQLASSSYEQYVQLIERKRITWMSMFYTFPSLMGKVSLSLYFDLVPSLRARYYSIAGISHTVIDSSEQDMIVTPRTRSNRALNKLENRSTKTKSSTNTNSSVILTSSSASVQHAVVLDILSTKLSYVNADNQTVTGFCSSWLCSLRRGDNVDLKLVRVPKFRLPYDIRSPIILVATGSGIAPLRAMWQERELRVKESPLGHAPGPFILLYGCRTEETKDWYYKDEMLKARAAGIITDLKLAVSRTQNANASCYVQDIFRSDTELQNLFLNNPKTQIIVCGGARMAYSLEEVIVRMHGVNGKKRVALLKQEGRLKLSVFGSENGATPAVEAVATLMAPQSPVPALEAVPALAHATALAPAPAAIPLMDDSAADNMSDTLCDMRDAYANPMQSSKFYNVLKEKTSDAMSVSLKQSLHEAIRAKQRNSLTASFKGLFMSSK